MSGGAVATVIVDGQSITVQTDGLVDDTDTLDSDDAVKRFVSAYVVIDPESEETISTFRGSTLSASTFAEFVRKAAGDSSED